MSDKAVNSEQLLKEYNCWRRGYSGYEMPSPTEIGIAIDSVLAQLAALREENERLKARVAELEEGSISKALFISRLQKLPDEHRMNMRSAEIICEIIVSIIDGDFDHKEPANEG